MPLLVGRNWFFYRLRVILPDCNTLNMQMLLQHFSDIGWADTRLIPVWINSMLPLVLMDSQAQMVRIHGKFLDVMIYKNRSSNIPNNDAQNTRRSSLHAPVRLVIAVILELGFAFYFSHEGALGIGLGFSDTAKKLLFIFVPTITILLLLPVIIRGSRFQKIAAIILSLFPAWMVYFGWKEMISHT